MKDYMNPTHEEYCDGIDSIKWTLKNIRREISNSETHLKHLKESEAIVLSDLKEIENISA